MGVVGLMGNQLRRYLRRNREDKVLPYVLTASSSPSFALKGLAGYEFDPLKDQNIAVHFLDVHKGHDTFMVSKALTRIYYIIEGTGVFTIDNQKYDVAPGLLVEVPPGVEYSLKRHRVGNDTGQQGAQLIKRLDPGASTTRTIER